MASGDLPRILAKMNHGDYLNSSDDVLDFYSEWANNYEEEVMTSDLHYSHPVSAAHVMSALLAGNKDAHILDIGAGTGLTGEQLHKVGFTTIDALDPSPEMLERARKKNVYTGFIEAFVGPRRLPIADNTYAGAVATGCFSPSHILPDAFDEIIRIIRPGGWFVGIMRVDWFEPYERVMRHHELQGRCHLVQSQLIDDKYADTTYLVFKLQIL